MSVDANELLLSSGVRSASFSKIGDSVSGVILAKPEVQQQRDFTTGEPKVYSDGNPRLQIRVVLSTEQRDPEDPDDNGERAVYIKGAMQKAVAAAVRKAGATGLQVGGKLAIKYTGDGVPAQRGLNPPKLFAARYEAPADVPVPVAEPEPARGGGGPLTDSQIDEIPFGPVF